MSPKFPLAVDTIEVSSPPPPNSEVPSFCKSTRVIPTLGPTEVLVRILCTGICHTDFFLSHQIGAVPGHEAVGIIEATGSSLTNASDDGISVKTGDRVGVGYGTGSCGLTSCRECTEGHETTCAEFTNFIGGAPHGLGTYASYVTRDVKFVFKIPDGLPSPYAGPLMCAGATVYSAIVEGAESGALRPGGTVGVVGIGGLGHLAIKFAVAMGYEAVALTRSPGKEALAKELGAKSVVVTSNDKLRKDAHRSIDLLLSTVPGNMDWGEYLELVRPRGRAVVVGVAPEPHIIPGLPLIVANRSFSGSLVAGSKHMKEMLQLAAEKNVYPKIECHPMTSEGAERAIKSVAENTVRFRAVLVADDCDSIPEATDK